MFILSSSVNWIELTNINFSWSFFYQLFIGFSLRFHLCIVHGLWWRWVSRVCGIEFANFSLQRSNFSANWPLQESSFYKLLVNIYWLFIEFSISIFCHWLFIKFLFNVIKFFVANFDSKLPLQKSFKKWHVTVHLHS